MIVLRFLFRMNEQNLYQATEGKSFLSTEKRNSPNTANCSIQHKNRITITSTSLNSALNFPSYHSLNAFLRTNSPLVNYRIPLLPNMINSRPQSYSAYYRHEAFFSFQLSLSSTYNVISTDSTGLRILDKVSTHVIVPDPFGKKGIQRRALLANLNLHMGQWASAPKPHCNWNYNVLDCFEL